MASREALIVANAVYSDPILQKLDAPGSDAHDFSEVLSNTEIGGFNVKEIIDRDSHDICIAIEEFLNNRAPDDLLLLYFSGHGIKDENGRLFFASRNTKRNLLRSTSVSAAMINEAMLSCRSRRQLLIIDCCFSGAFARGMTVKGSEIGTYDQFQGTGRIVLTASDAIQYALESESAIGAGKRSVFTEGIVEGLRTGAADTNFDGLITLDELYEYGSSFVKSRTPSQQPMKWVFGAVGEIIIANNNQPILQPAELPSRLLDALSEQSFPSVRQAAVTELGKLLHGRNRALALAARTELTKLTADDSRRISEIAQYLLGDQSAQMNNSNSVMLQAKPPVPKPPLDLIEKASAQQSQSKRNVLEQWANSPVFVPQAMLVMVAFVMFIIWIVVLFTR